MSLEPRSPNTGNVFVGSVAMLALGGVLGYAVATRTCFHRDEVMKKLQESGGSKCT